MLDVVYDVEIFPNVFLFTTEHTDAPFRWVYEISDWKNESSQLIDFLLWLRNQNGRMIGFNNLGFDYPIIHYLVRHGAPTAKTLYDKAQAIFDSQDENRWAHYVKPSEHLIPQIDLFKIHHFDNKAKTTSLKNLQFVMRSESVQDLPFAPGTVLTQEQVHVLRQYNVHDVQETKKFYHVSRDMIRFRENLSTTYKRDFMNHNDTKIGKDYFVMELEKRGIQCYEFGPEGRKPRQTKRPFISLKDAILPWVSFKHPEFNRVLGWLKQQTITETKGVFTDLTAHVNGFEFVFGLGGIHGSIESKIIQSDDEMVIVDLDVASYYPNLAIANGFYPAHLGKEFCGIYENLFEQRKQFKKGSAENAMLKLALNGVYGDSNNQFSVFYDPLYTMSITLNGQLLLCVLAEKLMGILGLQLVQCNTDGLTVRLPRTQVPLLDEVCDRWQEMTKLQLEKVIYRKMMIRDVNNYIAVSESGKIKRKGAYEHDLDWHQNHSALVVPKVAEQVLVNDAPIRKTVENWSDVMDFMLRTKVPRSSHLLAGEQVIQNNTRYYVAIDGVKLTKRMPPLKGKTEWRNIGIESGWLVRVCNDLTHIDRNVVNYDYYVNEVEKLVTCLQ